jgi:hypothetical protein
LDLTQGMRFHPSSRTWSYEYVLGFMSRMISYASTKKTGTSFSLNCHFDSPNGLILQEIVIWKHHAPPQGDPVLINRNQIQGGGRGGGTPEMEVVVELGQVRGGSGAATSTTGNNSLAGVGILIGDRRGAQSDRRSGGGRRCSAVARAPPQPRVAGGRGRRGWSQRRYNGAGG